MPNLYDFDVSSNLMTQIIMSNLSEYSHNVLAKAKAMITLQNNSLYFDTFFNKQSAYTYTINFNNNSLTNVFFNFKQLFSVFNSVIPSEDKYMLLKQAAVNLSPTNPTRCDCGLYNDVDFILNGAYNSSLKPTSLNSSNFAKTFCLSANKSTNIYTMVLKKDYTFIRQICPSAILNNRAIASKFSLGIYTILIWIFSKASLTLQQNLLFRF
jgi:hypothetical protein